MSQGNGGCVCGQVIFNLSGRKAGDTLTCPWCQKAYRYTEQGALELLARQAAQPPSTYKMLPVPPPLPKQDDARISQRRTGRHDPLVFPAKKSESLRLAGSPSESRRTTKRHDFKDIPGGPWRMILFIVIFNVAAFVALSFIFPKMPDGSRQNPWGEPILKSALWPEMAALIVGHVVGFIAWSFHVYRLQMKKFMTLQSGAPKPTKGPSKN